MFYDGIVVGDFVACMSIEGAVIIENTAVHALAQAREVRPLNRLTAAFLEIGLLIGFGAQHLEFQRRTYRKTPCSYRLSCPIS